MRLIRSRAWRSAVTPAALSLKWRLDRPPRSGVGSDIKDETNPLRSRRSKRGVERADGDGPARPALDFTAHGDAVRIRSQVRNRQENRLFEFAEGV